MHVAAVLLTACSSIAEARNPPGEAPVGVWLAGDTHVHTDHSADGSRPRQESDQRLPGNVSVADQIAQAERKRLDFVGLTDHRTHDQHWDPLWSSSKLLLLTGEEANGAPHAVVLGAVDQIVDGANPPGSAAFRHLQQSIWDAHAQNALWSVVHPDNGELGDDGRPNANASAQSIDTVEVWNPATDPDAQVAYAEDRWNRGFRFGAVAASDNHYREFWDIAGPGQPTTWVFAANRSERAILDALRAGRTTVSGSPDGAFLTLEIDTDADGIFEAMGGDEVPARTRERATLRIRIRNGAGMTVYVFRSPGRSAGTAAVFKPTAADETFAVPIEIGEGATWYRAEARSPGALSGLKANPSLPDQLRAATSPIFLDAGIPPEPQPEIPLPASTIASDGSTVAIEARDSFAGFPDVAVAGNLTHIVAEAHRNARASVIYRNTQSQPIDLTPQSQSARWPRLAAAGANVWVVWQDQRENSLPRRFQIYLRHSANGGKTWQPEIQVSSASGRAIHPAIGLLNEGCPVIAWSENGGGAFDIHARVMCDEAGAANLSASGKQIDPGTPLDTRSPRYPASLFPAVAVGKNGEIVIAWQDNRHDPDPLWTGRTPPPGEAPPTGTDPDNWEILTSTRRAGTAQWTPPVRVSANENAADRHPSIAADSTGRFVVAWETKPLQRSGANLSLRSSHSTNPAESWSAPQSIALAPDAMSQRPRLTADREDVFRVVWYDSRSADWRWRVLTSRLTPSLNWTPALRLTGAANATWPAVSQNIVVFTSDRRATRAQRDITQEVCVTQLK